MIYLPHWHIPREQELMLSYACSQRGGDRDKHQAAEGDEASPTRQAKPEPHRKMNTHQHWFDSLPFQQFQVLFNSLFKVLCIFPSRYLFAIGLSPIFSFRWNLPPILSCSPKQLDSLKACRTSQFPGTDGIVTLYDALFQETCPETVTDNSFYRLQFRVAGPHRFSS